MRCPGPITPGLALSLVALGGVLAYLAASRTGGYIGFPLDDAWIHQTYARNLAQTGQLAFVPGQPSAGSTSPAWTVLLAIGYGLGLNFPLWPNTLGAVLLAVKAMLAYHMVLAYWPGARSAAFMPHHAANTKALRNTRHIRACEI